MIFSRNISKTLWPEAFAYTCYIQNRSLTHALGGNTMPHEAFFNRKPDVSRLHEFGTKCWIMVPDQWCTKLDPKAEQHLFTGIAENTKVWQYYNTCSRIIQISKNIIFNKEDTNIYPIPEDEEEEIIPNLPIPTATITKVNDNTVEQAPTPNMETIVPSIAMPEPEPRQSSHIADQGTR